VGEDDVFGWAEEGEMQKNSGKIGLETLHIVTMAIVLSVLGVICILSAPYTMGSSLN
jgi:hypothetical protein